MKRTCPDCGRDEWCAIHRAAPELYRLLDLIVMEFKSDPMSIQCFDLDTIVGPAKTLIDKLAREKDVR